MDHESIESLNRFDKRLARDPGEALDLRNKSVLFFYTEDQKLLLLGMIDLSYVFWISVTDIRDREKNQAIFAHIIRAEPDAVLDYYRAIPQSGYGIGQLMRCYHGRLKSSLCEQKGLDHTQWVTPFGGRYGRMTPSSTGACFARDVQKHYEDLKARCRFRAADGAYLKILESYLQLLSQSTGDPCRDYLERKPLMDLIDSEEYLLCAEDPKLRDLYTRLVYRSNALYNAYMAVVR